MEKLKHVNEHNLVTDMKKELAKSLEGNVFMQNPECENILYGMVTDFCKEFNKFVDLGNNLIDSIDEGDKEKTFDK